MGTLTRRFAFIGALAALGLGFLVSAADAAPPQNRIRPGPLAPSVRRPYYVAPGLTIRQYAYNTALMGQAYSNYPAYMFGYNPYPQVVNYGPSYYNPYAAYPNLSSVYSGYYNPYLTSSLYANPYNPYGVYGYSYLYR